MKKTNLLVIDRGGSKSKYEQERKVVINTPSLVISPTETQKLLGCHIHENLKWTDHLMTNENSLLKGLNQRLAALKKLARIASFRDRKIVANGTS